MVEENFTCKSRGISLCICKVLINNLDFIYLIFVYDEIEIERERGIERERHTGTDRRRYRGR